jgi:peroxiredoxin
MASTELHACHAKSCRCLTYYKKRPNFNYSLNHQTVIIIVASTKLFVILLILLSASSAQILAQTSPEFPVSIQLQTVDGKSFDSKMFATDKELLVIDFWNRSCGPCIRALNAFRDNYDTLNNSAHAMIIAVAVQKRDEAILKLIEKEKWPFKVYFDTDATLFKQLSRWYESGTVVVAFPTMFIFDNTNKMLTRIQGTHEKFKEGAYPPRDDDHVMDGELQEIDIEAYYAMFEALRKK